MSPAAPGSSAARIAGHEVRRLDEGWEAVAAAPDGCLEATALEGLGWLPAQVPGTAAGVLSAAGRWRPGDLHDFDAEDWWFRTSFAAAPPQDGEEVVLRLDGIATVAEVYLNGELVLESDSMFARHTLHVGERLGNENELVIRCRALAPLLQERRRPRARWRTRVVAHGNLRFYRTSLIGRAPGFAPAPAPVGPWRPVTLEHRRRLAVDEFMLRTRVDSGGAGIVAVRASLRALESPPPSSICLELSGPSGTHSVALDLTAEGARSTVEGELTVPGAEKWWPHTHGQPRLHDVRLRIEHCGDSTVVEGGRVGFRSLAAGPSPDHDPEVDGLDLHVNGVRIFARGAVWTPVDVVGLAPAPSELRCALERARDAGMNMLRVPGTGAYESRPFHELCDELGLLVWQDFMFANLDYPTAEDAFRTLVEREAGQLLSDVAGRPSVAVLCGNSEIEQQVAMLGLDQSLGRGEFFGEVLPRMVREAGTDAVYIPSAPCGGELPFRPDRGVANYFGVGAYRRALEDARRADVRFASECLAFANVPDEALLEELVSEGSGPVRAHDPRWKAGVPRDAGAGWDFDDVRDHYLALMYGVDPGELRRLDHQRYLDLSRAVSGEVMAEVFGEWRRAGSRCRGGLVLWLSDLAPGAGWGVLDYHGRPKVVYHHLRRALSPIAVWTTDEGLGGIALHVANDRDAPLSCRLRVALYRDHQHCVHEAEEHLELGAHAIQQRNVEGMLGQFVDASWAYRFGPPAQDVIVASLERDADGASELLSQTVRFPVGRSSATDTASRLGLVANVQGVEAGVMRVVVRSDRLAYGVRLHVPGFLPDDDAFPIEPGHERTLLLRTQQAPADFAGGAITALNLEGRVRILAAPPA